MMMFSEEGRHIPRCLVCADPPYTLTPEAGEIDRNPMDLLEELLAGDKLAVYAGEFHRYDGYYDEYREFIGDELRQLKQIIKEIGNA